MKIKAKHSFFSSLNTFELMFSATMGVCIGVFFWMFTFVHSLFEPFLQVLGLNYITNGLWMISAIFPALIIRKPSAALISSVLAALIEGLLAKWGLITILWGFFQGLGAEIVFALFLYRRWNWPIVALASVAASLSGYAVDFFIKQYWLLKFHLIMTQLGSSFISSLILCALPSLWLCKKLKKTGLLNSFLIMQEKGNF